MTGYIDPTKEDFARFRHMQRAGAIHMLNLVRFRPMAAYDDGTVATGEEAYRNYARESGPIFARLGGRQVWVGKPELILIGPSDEHWDLAGSRIPKGRPPPSGSCRRFTFDSTPTRRNWRSIWAGLRVVGGLWWAGPAAHIATADKSR